MTCGQNRLEEGVVLGRLPDIPGVPSQLDHRQRRQSYSEEKQVSSNQNGAEPSIHVLLAESHPLMCLGLRTLFELDTEIEIIAEARDGSEVLGLIETLLPDVALLDLSLPGATVSQIVTAIRQRCWPTRTLALTADIDHESLQEAILAGVNGCLLKSKIRRSGVQAVRTVADGHSWFSPEIMRAMATCCERRAQYLSQRPKLTSREVEVIRLLGQGWTNHRIAYTLGVKERTIRFHLGNIYRKLSVKSRAEASAWAAQNGLIDPGDPV